MNEYYYEATRNGRQLAITMMPFEIDGHVEGSIQSFVVKRESEE